MKKKTLLLTTLAGTMLLAGMTASSVNAASDKAIARTSTGYPVTNLNSVVVELMNGETQLLKEDLIELVEEKFVKTESNQTVPMNVKVASIVDKDGKEVTDGKLVGTGATITLNTGKEVLVVLYGDVDGNGMINILDADRVAAGVLGRKTLTDVEKAAGNIVANAGNTSELNVLDADRIAAYIGEEYAKETYVDHIPTQDTMVQTIDLSATKIANASGNDNKIGQVVVDGNTIKLRVVPDVGKTLEKTLEDFTSSATNVNGVSTTAKWYKINLVTGLNATDVEVTGANFVNGVLWLKAEDGTEMNVTIKNKKDPSEVMEVKIIVVDATDVNVRASRKIEANAGNEGQVDTVGDISLNAIAVGAKVSSMVDSYNDVTKSDGRWFGIELITTMPASALEVIEKSASVDTEESHTYYKIVGSDTPITSADASYSASEKRYVSTVYVDGLSNSVQLIVKNKESVTTLSSLTAITVNVTNNGGLVPTTAKASSPALAGGSIWAETDFDSLDKVMNNNQTAITTVSNNKKANVIEVEAKLSEMKRFNISNNKVVPVDNTGKGENETGKKYYAILVDFGTSADQITIDGVDYTILNSNLTNFNNGKNLANTVLIWLDAEAQYPITFTLQGGNANHEAVSKMTMTVNLTDVSQPVVIDQTDVRKLDDTVKSINTFDNSAKANTQSITANVRKSALTAETKYEKESLWYPLVVDTGVNNKELTVNTKVANKDYEVDQNVEGLSNTEVIVWVDANASSVFTITNKNATTNTFTLTVTTTEASDLQLGNLSKVTTSTTSGADGMVKSLLGENYEAYESNMAAVAYTNGNSFSAVGTTQDKLYIIDVNRNLLKKFSFEGHEEGAWIALKLAVKDATRIQENDLFDLDHATYFNVTTTSEVLIWIDALKLPVGENRNGTTITGTPVSYTVTSKDVTTGVEETVTFKIISDDTSTFKDNVSSIGVTQGYGPAENESIEDYIEAHPVGGVNGHFTSMTDKSEQAKYLTNQALIESIVSKKEGNTVTITVTGDFNNMYKITNNNGLESRMVTLKFDLGYNYTKAINNDLYYKVTTDDDGKVWDQSWAGDWYVGDEDDYDCSETETYWNINVKEIPGRSTGTIYTRGIKFCKDSEGNSDVLEFAINFVQGNSDSAKRDEIYNNYVEMLSE